MIHHMVVRVLAFLFLLMLALLAVALISVLSAERDEIRRLPRGAWVALILLVPVVGAALYLWLGRPRRAPGARLGPVAPPRVIAPDDDPEFLRRLSPPNPPKPPVSDDIRPAEDSRTTDDRPPTDG